MVRLAALAKSNARFVLFFAVIVTVMHVESLSSAAEPKDSKLARNRLTGEDKNEKDPLLIRSETLNADSIKRVFIYKKNVEMTRGDLIVTSDIVTGHYNEQNEIETIVCEGNVVITRGEELHASSDVANYDVKKGVIELTQNPEVSQNGNVLAADKVIVYVNEEKSDALGNVHVKVADTKSTLTGVGSIGKTSSSGQQPAGEGNESLSSSGGAAEE